MCEIQPLDKDTIQVTCSDVSKQIQTGDTLIFKVEYLDYSVGDEIVVEPIIDQNEVQLLCRSNSRHITESGILELVCRDIITVN